MTVLAAIALSMTAQAADMESGTWVLNVAKSSDSRGNMVRSRTQVVSYEGGWRINRQGGIDKDGKPFSGNNISKYDGQARPTIQQSPNATATLSTSTKSDDFHAEVVTVGITSKARNVQNVVYSPDGKTKTNTTTGVDEDGKAYTNVSVLERR